MPLIDTNRSAVKKRIISPESKVVVQNQLFKGFRNHCTSQIGRKMHGRDGSFLRKPRLVDDLYWLRKGFKRVVGIVANDVQFEYHFCLIFLFELKNSVNTMSEL